MPAPPAMIAVRVLGKAAFLDSAEKIGAAILRVLASPETAACGVCDMSIDAMREDVKVELRQRTINREKVIAALLLCPRCAASWPSRNQLLVVTRCPTGGSSQYVVTAGPNNGLH